MTCTSASTGAEGVDYNVTCPICGKERGPNCQNQESFAECPNKNVECKNKDSSNRRIGCRGSLSGYQGYGSYLGSNILTATYDISKEAKSPTVNSIKDRMVKRENGTSVDSEVIDKGSHPLYVGQNSIQAHHLITSEIMKDEDEKWVNVCKITRYNVNCKLNGIFLPTDMELACYKDMQRHAGSHYMGKSVVDEKDQKHILSYVKGVEKELNILLNTFSNETIKEKCNATSADKLVEQMNELSVRICVKIKKYEWTISWDSANYNPKAKPRIGCANVNSIPKKKEKFFRVYENKLKENQLVPENLDDSGKWKSRNFDDMETIQQLVEEDPGDICCTNLMEHYNKFEEILASKTKEYKFEVGY